MDQPLATATGMPSFEVAAVKRRHLTRLGPGLCRSGPVLLFLPRGTMFTALIPDRSAMSLGGKHVVKDDMDPTQPRDCEYS
jgi:hypothetical protein